MKSELLYECQLDISNHVCHLVVYVNQLIITKVNFVLKQETSSRSKIFDLTSPTTKISWERSLKKLVGFQISFLSQKTRQQKKKSYKGHNTDVVNLKKVLDGRAFYCSFYKQYVVIKTFSDDHFGKIRQCQNIYTHEIKIRKKLPFHTYDNNIPNEVKLAMKLKQYPHKNILNVDEIYIEEDGYYLVMDLCEGSTLFKYFFNQDFRIPQNQISKIMKRILKAVCHLHENQIMHRDLKFDNILLRNKNDIKSLQIIDFGLASDIDTQPQIFCGTPGYIAPEILNGKAYNQLCDVYSLGCLFHSLLSGDRLFPQQLAQKDLLQLNRQNCYKISSKIQDHFARDLIIRMLNSQNHRPSPSDCLKHPFFSTSIQDKLKSMDFPLMKNPFILYDQFKYYIQ